MRERMSSVCRKQQPVGVVVLEIQWGSCWRERIVQNRCKPTASPGCQSTVVTWSTRPWDVLGQIGNTHIALGDEAGAELQIVLKIEGTAELVLGAEARHGLGLGQLLHTSDTPELLVLRVLGDGEPRAPAIPAAMVVVGDSRGCCRCGMLLVGVEVVVRSHGC